MRQLPSNQRGASVTTIVLGVIALGLLMRLAIGAIPAYIGDYQFQLILCE